MVAFSFYIDLSLQLPDEPFTLYLLNVWVSENSFCLYHKKVQDKSNEITAILETLDVIDVTGATVFIDAMGTQREQTLNKWTHISTIIKLVSTREIKGISAQNTRYYISDEDKANAAYYQSLARGHWGIENQLHWALDVVFKEDACRTRGGGMPHKIFRYSGRLPCIS